MLCRLFDRSTRQRCKGVGEYSPSSAVLVLQHEGPGEKRSINGGRRRERERVRLMLQTSARKVGNTAQHHALPSSSSSPPQDLLDRRLLTSDAAPLGARLSI